jgi:hypothetical protein
MSMSIRRRLLFLGIPFVLGCGTSASSLHQAELKVSRAVLYQNGIGYFERRGHLVGDTLRLRVRPDQIRDVLKSLTIVDLRDGRPISIALPIEKSRAKQLADLPEQVRTQGGILAIAQAFRGARCVIDADHHAEGRLTGVENLGNSQDRPDWRLSVLTDGGALVQLKAAEVKSLRVLDGSLEIGLRKALDVALDAGAWKPVDLTVRLAGRSPHELLVSYVVEMPAWKPAYRVLLTDKERALLQGWAVVDNLSGDDWKGVQLSLTAGTPLAFTYDLYTPRFAERPHLTAHDEIAELPPEAFQAVGGLSDRAAVQEEKNDVPSASAGYGQGRSGKDRKKAVSPRRPAPTSAPAGNQPSDPSKELLSELERGPDAEALQRNFRTLVAGTQAGSLFRFDLEEPVTVDERQSALVNLVSTKVEGRDVLLFRVGQDGVNPYRAVRFSNQTGFVLESGPMAIYRSDALGGSFLGEALVSRMEKNATMFVPYALDGRIRITLDEEQKDEGVTLLRLVRGVVSIETKRVTRFKYDVDNGSGEETTLYVRRERRPGWKLAVGQKVLEEGGAYYLPIDLPKSGRIHVTVAEETPVRGEVDIFSEAASEAIRLYLSSTSTDRKIVPTLREALELRDKLGALDLKVAASEEQRSTLANRQAEVRENLRVLGKASQNADLKKKLEETLVELEQQLNEVTRSLVKLSIDRSTARDRLSVLVRGITLDPKSAP